MLVIKFCLEKGAKSTKMVVDEYKLYTSTFETKFMNSKGKNTYWNYNNGNISISPIDRSFSPKEIERTVENLVMSRFGSEYTKKFRKSFSRRSRKSLISSVDTFGSYNFDDKSFLRKALGNEFNSLKNLPSSSGISSVSVNTYNLSELLSNENLYNSFGTLGKYEDVYSESSQKIPLKEKEKLENYHENFKLQLYQELYILHHSTVQILKAIDYDNGNNQEELSSVRAEAEKLLLLADFKKQLLHKKIDEISLYSNNENDAHIGSVNIFCIHLWPNESKCCDQYFICLLIYDTQVYTTEISTVKSNGAIHLRGYFTISKLPHNFKIHLKIFTMPMKKEKKFDKKLLQDISNYTSLFTLWGEAEISDADLKHNSQLTNIYLPLNNSRITVHISSKAHINQNLSGFLNVAQNHKSCQLWNRQWVVLRETVLNFWNYPSEEMYNNKARKSFNLALCEQVRCPTREECSRARTLLLKMKNGEEILVTADSLNEFHRWKKALEVIVTAAKFWKNI